MLPVIASSVNVECVLLSVFEREFRLSTVTVTVDSCKLSLILTSQLQQLKPLVGFNSKHDTSILFNFISKIFFI